MNDLICAKLKKKKKKNANLQGIIQTYELNYKSKSRKV